MGASQEVENYLVRQGRAGSVKVKIRLTYLARIASSHSKQEVTSDTKDAPNARCGAKVQEVGRTGN